MAGILEGLWETTVADIIWHRKMKTGKNLLWDNFCYFIFQRNKAYYGDNYFYRTPTMNPASYEIEDIVLWAEMDRKNELVSLPHMPDEIRLLLGQQPHKGAHTVSWPQTRTSRQDKKGEDKTKWKDNKGKGKSYQPKNAGSSLSEEPSAGTSETPTKGDGNTPTPTAEHREAGTSPTQGGGFEDSTAEDNAKPRGADTPRPSHRFSKGTRSPTRKAPAKTRSQSAGPLTRMRWSETHDAEELQEGAVSPNSMRNTGTWTSTETEGIRDEGKTRQSMGQASTLPTEEETYHSYYPYYPMNFPPCPAVWLPGGTSFLHLQEGDLASTISISPTDHQLALTDIPTLQCRFYLIQEPESIIVAWKEVLNEKEIKAADFISYIKFINQQLPILDAAELESGTKELKGAKKCADQLGGSLFLNSLIEARTTAQQIFSLKVNARRALLQLYEFQLIPDGVNEKAGTPTWNHMSNTLADFLVDTRFIDAVRTYLKENTGNSSALYSYPGQLDLSIELKGKLYRDGYYPNDQVYRLNTKYRIRVGQETSLTLEKEMRVDIVFPQETPPPPGETIQFDTTWTAKPKGINSGTQQCDITSECASFLDQVEALRHYSRMQAIRLGGNTSIFQSLAVNNRVQELTSQSSQDHPVKILPETVAEMHGEDLHEPSEEPDLPSPNITSEAPIEEAPATRDTEESNDEDDNGDNHTTHSESAKSGEQEPLAQDASGTAS